MTVARMAVAQMAMVQMTAEQRAGSRERGAGSVEQRAWSSDGGAEGGAALDAVRLLMRLQPGIFSEGAGGLRLHGGIGFGDVVAGLRMTDQKVGMIDRDARKDVRMN